MNKKEIIKKLVDRDTGECIDIYEGERFRIIKESQQKAIDNAIVNKELNGEIVEINKELGGFVFVLFKYCSKILEQHPEIKPEDVTKLFYLATFVDYDGYLVFNNQYMKRKTIQELLKISREKFSNYFNKLKRLNIFICDENKNIKINKDYFVKGEIDSEIKENYNYTRIYINSIRYLFENVSINKHKQLGNYFRIIPYIHRQQNALSWNPESNYKDIQLMNIRDLQEVLGYHRNGIRGLINELLSIKLENGEPIFLIILWDKDEGKSYILVNPKVLYGGNFNLDDKGKNILKWFNIKDSLS